MDPLTRRQRDKGVLRAKEATINELMGTADEAAISARLELCHHSKGYVLLSVIMRSNSEIKALSTGSERRSPRATRLT